MREQGGIRKAWGDLIGGCVLLAVGFYAIITGMKLELGSLSAPQPGFIPFLSGGAMAILSVALIGKALLGRGREAEAETPEGLGKPVLVIAGLAAYVLILESLGYLITTAVLTVFFLWVLGVRKWWSLVLATILLAGGSYFLFDRLLGVTLPAGILTGVL